MILSTSILISEYKRHLKALKKIYCINIKKNIIPKSNSTVTLHKKMVVRSKEINNENRRIKNKIQEISSTVSNILKKQVKLSDNSPKSIHRKIIIGRGLEYYNKFRISKHYSSNLFPEEYK